MLYLKDAYWLFECREANTDAFFCACVCLCVFLCCTAAGGISAMYVASSCGWKSHRYGALGE